MKEKAAVEFRVLHYQTAFLWLEKNLRFKGLTLTTNLKRNKRKQVKSINRDTMHSQSPILFRRHKDSKERKAQPKPHCYLEQHTLWRARWVTVLNIAFVSGIPSCNQAWSQSFKLVCKRNGLRLRFAGCQCKRHAWLSACTSGVSG